jgi:hypothetical protein
MDQTDPQQINTMPAQAAIIPSAPTSPLGLPPSGGPNSLRQLLIAILWQLWQDIHVKASAAVILGLMIYAARHPESAATNDKIIAAATGWLGGSALVGRRSSGAATP